MTPSEAQVFIHSLRSAFSYIEALHIPTIAVIEGAALGGGLELALSCGLRICGEDATLALSETGLAIIPGAGRTKRLPRLVGKSLAKELIFTARRISGRDVVSMGLANYSVPTGEARDKAIEIAREINEKLNDDKSPFQRAFVNQVKRCREMSRKLRFFKEQLSKAGLLYSTRLVLEPYIELEELEIQLAEHEHELIEMNSNSEKLHHTLNELLKFKIVLQKAGG